MATVFLMMAGATAHAQTSPPATGRILLEYWHEVAGANVPDLTGHARYPNRPTGRDFPTRLEAVADWGQSYGTRVRGYVHPPTSGAYTFWIAGDDTAELWLSTDESPAHRKRIASVPGHTAPREWTKHASQQSSEIALVGGRRYYVEALHKQGTGGDHLAVGWRLSNGALERPIDGNRLSPYEEAETLPAQADVLDRLATGHPRLLASAQGFARAKQRLTDIPQAGQMYASVKNGADAILAEPVSTYEIPDGLRLLETSRKVLNRIEKLAFVYRMSGDARYLNRAWAELDAASKFPDWNPRHFLDTAEMTAAFAIGYDWLYAAWTPAQRATLRSAIVNKGLTPVLSTYRNNKGWARDSTNWNAVCNGGMTLGALAIGDEEPVLASEILYHAGRSVPKGLVGFGPDGGWDEGPGYWSYGTKYMVYFLAATETALGTNWGTAMAPGVSETGYFPLYITKPSGRTFNYSDGGDQAIGGSQMYWLAGKYGRSSYGAFARQLGWAGVRDLLWYDTRGDSPQASGLPLDRVFHSCEVATFRSAWGDTNALFAGLKAGNNQHGHEQLDIGTFVLDALGERWAIELGNDSYSLPGYFNYPSRFTYYRMRAEGQNTLVINPGSGLDQSQTLSAPILRFASTPSRAYAVADLTPAYAGHVQKAWRGLALLEGRKQVLLQDEVEAVKPAELWWFMHTQAAVQITDNGKSALLTRGNKRLWARIASGPSSAVFTLRDAKPLPTSPDPQTVPSQNGNSSIRKLTIHLTGVTNLRLGVLFVPLDAGESPPGNVPSATPLADWTSGSTPVPPVNKAPNVALTSPTNGAPFTAPATITLATAASDPDGTIAKVEFYQGTTLLHTEHASPYTFSWTNVPAGSYTLLAKAYDNLGAVATSASVSVTVSPAPPANKAPSVTLTSPATGAAFTAPTTIALTATASDTDGTVAKVEFFRGATKLGEDTSSPYTYAWTGVAAGTYSLSAKATDNDGDSTASVAITVTVDAALPAPDLAPTLVNLALGKSATQSSTPAGATSGANRAQLALDNNTDGHWNHGSVTHTNYQTQPWWQLDLGATRAITTIELFNRTDAASERLSNFVVLVSDTPFTSNDLNTTLVQPGVWHFRHNPSAGSPTRISVHRMGRYVRVQLMGTNFLSIAEVKVLGYADALPNLALNKMASQSSRPQGTPAPSAALDGNTDGRWSGGSITHTGLDKQAWWQVDLGQSQDITTINLFNRSDNSQARLSNVHVFVSEQPFTSTDLITTLKQPGVWHGYVAGTVANPTSVPVHRSGRYVRVQLGDTGYLSLAEVQVIGFPGPNPDQNLAQGKSATQSSRPQGTPAPSAAVDGNINGAWGGGSITHTNLDKQAWWQVDLGASGAITCVEIFNRTDNSQERLGDLFVLVSDSPFASASLQAALSQPGVWATHVPVQAGAPTSVPVHRSGRYVRVQLAGTNYLSLAEVKVLGLPIIGAPTTTSAAGSITTHGVNSSPALMASPGSLPAAPQAAAKSSGKTATAPSTPPQAQGAGLLGAYFDNSDGTHLKTVRVDKTIDFDWGKSVPRGTALTSPDTFGVRWTGWVEAPVSGLYTFTTTSDDGIRLQVDGKLLVNDWTTHAPQDHQGTIVLRAGRRYPLVVEYFEKHKSATAKLWWAYPGQRKQIVPTRWLWPSK